MWQWTRGLWSDGGPRGEPISYLDKVHVLQLLTVPTNKSCDKFFFHLLPCSKMRKQFQEWGHYVTSLGRVVTSANCSYQLWTCEHGSWKKNDSASLPSSETNQLTLTNERQRQSGQRISGHARLVWRDYEYRNQYFSLVHEHRKYSPITYWQLYVSNI